MKGGGVDLLSSMVSAQEILALPVASLDEL